MKPVIHSQVIKGVAKDIKMAEPTIFVDNENRVRSGHMSHAMTEFKKGNIVAFNSNCSAFRCNGHSAYGWIEYAISNDYGETWGERKILQHTFDMLLDGVNTCSIEKAVTCPNGDVAAFILLNDQTQRICCEPWLKPPMVTVSSDGLNTWSKPVSVTPYAGRIYDVLVFDGAVYVLQSCNDATKGFWLNEPEHCYRLYKSVDNCKTFTEVCVVPFIEKTNLCYGNMTISPKGELICYAYNIKDEKNMSYAVSPDFGCTWTEKGKSHVENRIRNPQIGRLDGQYILTGRAGQDDPDSVRSMVIYTSIDGINWDSGLVLGNNERRSCFYSENLTVTMPNGKERMYLRYSENVHVYSEVGLTVENFSQVNGMMTYFETVEK